MGSKKRSAWAKQKAEFNAQLGGMDDVFAREDARHERQQQERESARRYQACERKNRYTNRAEAEAAIASCEDYGTHGLTCYKCEYCGGWHLTSHGTR